MEYRHVEILRDGEWVRDEFENVREGDSFKIFEPDGTFVHQGIALTDPEPCEPEGNWIIHNTIEELVDG